MTVAFPFSSIKLHEPDERVVELAALVAALAERLSEVAPGDDTAQLVERAPSGRRRVQVVTGDEVVRRAA